MPTTYILKCKDNRYYIGSTKNLQQRISEHSKGKCKFTKSRLPVKVVYKESFNIYSEARKRESQLKKLKSRFQLEKLIKYR